MAVIDYTELTLRYTDYADFVDRLQTDSKSKRDECTSSVFSENGNVNVARVPEENSQTTLTSVKIIISAGAGPGDNTQAAERLAGIFKEDKIDIDISLATGLLATRYREDADF